MDYIEKQITGEQFYSEDGQKLMRLEAKKTAMLNRQGYYSKGVARLGDRIVKLKIKMGLLVQKETQNT